MSAAVAWAGKAWVIAAICAIAGCAALSPDTDQDQRMREIAADVVEQRATTVSGGAAGEADTTAGSGNVENVTNDIRGYVWIAAMLIAGGFVVSPTIRGLFELKKAKR